MAEPQEPSDSAPDGAATPPPAKKTPAKAGKKPAKAAPDKAPEKAPAKKAPAKKAAAKPVAKKAPAKKAPAKKAPAPSPEPPVAAEPLDVQERVETNGQLEAAKDAAAQAKSTVDDANSPIASTPQPLEPSSSRLPLAVAITLSLLAVLLIRQLRRR
jgi:hypothetical protein